jgi:hypothetical protein
LTSGNDSLTEALIKAKVVAHKLKNKELDKWISNELEGYPNQQVPPYRTLECVVVGNITNGYVLQKNYQLPLLKLDEEKRISLQNFILPKSIASLDSYIKTKDGSKLVIQVLPEFCSFLNKGLQDGWWVVEASREVDKIQVIECMTKIRTKLLSFMLDLNEEIQGDEVDKQDIPKLKEKIDNLFNSAIFGDNATIIVGNQNSQTVTNTNIKGNFEELEKTLQKNNVSQEDIIELREIIAIDDADHKNQKYGKKVQTWFSKMINKAMNTGWNISIGAAGSTLAKALNGYYGWAP